MAQTVRGARDFRKCRGDGTKQIVHGRVLQDCRQDALAGFFGLDVGIQRDLYVLHLGDVAVQLRHPGLDLADMCLELGDVLLLALLGAFQTLEQLIHGCRVGRGLTRLRAQRVPDIRPAAYRPRLDARFRIILDPLGRQDQRFGLGMDGFDRCVEIGDLGCGEFLDLRRCRAGGEADQKHRGQKDPENTHAISSFRNSPNKCISK